MTNFFYRVKTANNKIIESHIEASGISDAAMQLERQGFVVLEIREEIKTFDSKSIDININKDTVFSLNEKKEFFNSFYNLYKSGLSMIEILETMVSSSKNLKLRMFCSKIMSRVNKGHSLKESLKGCSNILGLAYTMLLCAGENSGKLDEVLSGILKSLEREEEIKTKVISSITYPAGIFLLAVGVALIFKFFIIKVFAAAGDVNIPMLAVSTVIKIAIVYACIFALAFYVWKNTKLQRQIIDYFSKSFVFSNLMKNYYFFNFFNVMALAYSSGVTASESVYLSQSVVNMSLVKNKLKKVQNMIENGCEVATAFSVADVFSSYALSQISAGEKAGELEKSFKIIAHDYENRVDLEIKTVLKLIEPLMIVVVGIFVGYVVYTGFKAYINGIFSML